MSLYESIMTIYAKLWDLWSLYVFNYEIDDVYEKICYVKGYFSHYDNRSLVINDVKSYSYVLTLCGQMLKKEEELCLWVKLLTKFIMFLMMFMTIEVYYFFYMSFDVLTVSCGILT